MHYYLETEIDIQKAKGEQSRKQIFKFRKTRQRQESGIQLDGTGTQSLTIKKHLLSVDSFQFSHKSIL